MSKSVAVVGAGLVGRGWAIVFARAGHEVRLFDVTEKKIADAVRVIERISLTWLPTASLLMPVKFEGGSPGQRI
jgi:L-gulonate 3-dehydrogenase